MPKVLLVEDDNNLREIFQMRLQAEGYTALVAADGEEGLVTAMKEKPDLIIADVMMPKLSGFEMIESLRATPEMKNVKVVMMTALGQAEDQARGEKLGVVKYLVKSQVTLEDFARVVKEVLGPGSPGGAPATNQTVSSTNNQQESENSMQEDPTNNATPSPSDAPADSSAPASNPMGDTPAVDSGADQQTSAQESSAVQGQINDFTGGTPDAGSTPTPAADTPGSASDSTGGDAPTPPPASEPPAAPTTPPAGTDTPPAGDSSTPSDPTSNAL